MRAEDLVKEPWAFGPYCWVVDEVRAFETPLHIRGLQGLWPIGHKQNPREVAEEVSAALHALVPEMAGSEWQGLTLLQPYATAIAQGPKRIENRPWSRALPAGGIWLGLHAGKASFERGPELIEDWKQAAGLWPGVPELADMPFGAMLGAFHVAQILEYPGGGS